MVSGDSAGGGMALALMMYLRDEGYPMPSGAMLLSPWCDLTMSCDSWETNEVCHFFHFFFSSLNTHLTMSPCIFAFSVQPYDFLPMVKPGEWPH